MMAPALFHVSFFRNVIFLALISISIIFLPIGCKKDTVTPEEQAELDAQIIKKYIEDNQLTATSTVSGLHYVVLNSGTGLRPSSVSSVKVAYKGYFTTGSIFDQSPYTGIDISLENVIKGWQEGIPFFREGGKGVLLIPSGLGYGSTPRDGIPANSVLIFDIDLIKVYN